MRKVTYKCLVEMRTSALWAAEMWWAEHTKGTPGAIAEAISYYKIMNRIERAMWSFPAVNTLKTK